MRESGYGMPPYGVGHASGAPPRAPGGPRPCGRRSLGTAPRSGHAPRPLRGGGQKRGREVRALVRLGGELTPEHYLVCEDALARAVTATDPQRFHADLLASCYDLRSLVGARVEGLCQETLLAWRALIAHDPEWCLPSLVLDEVGRPAETGPLLRPLHVRLARGRRGDWGRGAHACGAGGARGVRGLARLGGEA